MSFLHEVKYKGCIPLQDFQATHAQPRPGALEARYAVTKVAKAKTDSRIVVISCSPDNGVKCVDTSFNPPSVVLDHTVYEIAHCGVDNQRPRYFSIIVGRKGDNTFFCHVFKASNKDNSLRITRGIASACTLAFQEHQKKSMKRAASTKNQSPAPTTGGPQKQPSLSQRHKASMRASVKRPGAGAGPKLTDSWFRPSMTRGEVNTILRNAAIGDFIVRESQSRPNDYAISVQTGSMIWTGLVVSVGGGYQLGERGGLVFPELTDLIGYFSQNKFMNDSNGAPLTLRLPYDSSAQPAFKVADWRQASKKETSSQSFNKNPPGMFEDIMNGNFAGEMEWPESSDEEDGSNFEFLSSRSGGKGRVVDLEDMDEREAFEKFMNQGGFDLDEEGNPIDISGLNVEDDEYEDDEYEQSHIPANATNQDVDAAFGSAPAPSNTTNQDLDEAFGGSGVSSFPETSEPVPPMTDLGLDDDESFTCADVADAVWASLEPDSDMCIHGQDVRPVLLKSGLDVPALGQIWMQVDTERRGKVDYDQLLLILGLMSQVQRGEEPNLEDLDTDDIPVPQIEGLLDA